MAAVDIAKVILNLPRERSFPYFRLDESKYAELQPLGASSVASYISRTRVCTQTVKEATLGRFQRP